MKTGNSNNPNNTNNPNNPNSPNNSNNLNNWGNAHTHTVYCDGNDTPQAMVEAALAAGFGHLGFSGHSFCAADGFGMQPEAMAAYKAAVREVQREYAGRIRIYLGLELDSMSEMPPVGEFEYLIGSVHNVMAPDGRSAAVCPVDSSPEIFEESIAACGGLEAFIRAYFAEYDRMLCERRVDIAGHFDLICKFNEGNRYFDENAPEYKEMAAAVLRRHCGQVVFEINTGGISKGWRSRPYPDYWLWEILRDEGASVIINTDTHSALTVDYAMNEMRERAVEMGLKVVTLEYILAGR